MTAKISPGLYAITQQDLSKSSLLEKTRDIVTGGAVMLQYRAKADADLDLAQQLLSICRAGRVVFIVNDNPKLAHTIGADGVHLGVDDPALPGARRLLGNDAIIGVSCYTSLARAVQAQKDGADYAAFGSFFDSPTKPDASRAELALLVQARRQRSIPIVAIGGITPANGRSLIDAGADLLAVISGVYGTPNAESSSSAYAALFQ